MIRPHLEWLLPPPIPDPPTLEGFGAPVSTLLARRGIRTDADLARLLQAGVDDLVPLELMTDAGAALDRIQAAIERGETIAIWGDYDADGMTAIAIWVLALRVLGIDPVRYVPSRLAEGYGLSVDGMRTLARRGVRLVVTCDCGVANAAEVDAARELGMDVVITDHHIPPTELPRAVAVVDPRRADCVYPNPDLTGAGLAYRLAVALLARRGSRAADLAALAAIGTIADLAPLTGECRAIVRLGLAELAETRHPGLRGLLARAAEDPSRPTARDIGFGVVPRLNAAGRIDDAELALNLLVESDPAAAEAMLGRLEEVHLRRREMTTTAVEAARQMADRAPGERPLVLRNDDWAPGLLGLVAGRLADELVRPVAVASRVEAEIRGSVRATPDFHVTAALEACGTYLLKRGGHAAAGGFSAAPESWEAFAAAFADLPRPYPPVAGIEPMRPGRLAIDLVLTARHLGWPLATELDRLTPFGPGHLEPLLAVTGLRVGDARRVGAAADHLAIRLRRGIETVDAIAFGMTPEREIPAEGLALDVVGYLERRTVEGEPRLRLRVLDYAEAAASPLLARRVGPAVPAAPSAAG